MSVQAVNAQRHERQLVTNSEIGVHVMNDTANECSSGERTSK
jgi:hypothetical protein